MNLTPRELRIFVSLASSLSFVQTADSFFVTQPTMSKMVKSIEDKLGVKLFERTTRNVTLTREGHNLLQVASRIVEDYEAGLSQLAEVARRGSQKLAIAALPSLAATLLLSVVAVGCGDCAFSARVFIRLLPVSANFAAYFSRC